MSAELLIQNKDKLFYPAVLEGIDWSTERKGSPGKLTFKAFMDDANPIMEGNAVRFQWNGGKVFYGFVFSKKMDKERIVNITAYDQLRYLKNKDTYVYENKTADEVAKMIFDDFKLQAGTIDPTGYKIASRVEDNQTLWDIIQNAYDLTLQNQKKLYVMYNDFEKIAIRNIDNMRLDLLIDEETGENFDYQSSIDENTFNQIKLSFANEESGTRDIYIAKDTNHINEWGVLQYYDTLQKGENGQAKADALLSLYNQKTRKLSIKGACGDIRVRAGTMVVVVLNLGDVKIKNLMLVESCKHTFLLDEHTMDLNLRGGEFIG